MVDHHKLYLVCKNLLQQSSKVSLSTAWCVDDIKCVKCRQVKVSMLTYLHNLSLMLEPTDLVNSSDIRLAVSRVVTWTTEPKSAEVRKVIDLTYLTYFNIVGIVDS